jgi:aspartyl-tRNA(Asn)/glutamyl-tRNA(Gln) amidotransferase subunit C
MSVSRDDVAHIAELAELDLADVDQPELAAQLSRILEYVAQLRAVPTGDSARPFIAGPDAARVRPDEVRPWPLAGGPADIAPAFKDGFFVVPRLGQFEEDATAS